MDFIFIAALIALVAAMGAAIAGCERLIKSKGGRA
ncbi:hypothetical protein EV670_0629 [Rivibacter subsaxonicus]|uniref:Uncharacterized protein n=1 Tax=Rivibacter subsaxonicus TaxID=457575 RepID=A0A4Q7W0A0_9BURK|nr:hypothetical protein EV670_0629 [Rivibacter subsaxonicus]